MNVLALDIGGANIKAADGGGQARAHAFALWQKPDDLGARLEVIVDEFPACRSVVATMTGELADCYASKRQGVAAIIDALTQAAQGREVMVYLADGSWAEPSTAKARYPLAAAANWHALARYAARFAGSQDALLIDVGSTTCDLVPLINGGVANLGQTDTQRLLAHELVYTGVERTPVCALVDLLPYRQSRCPVARELFATTLDVYLLLSEIAEDETNCTTADGQPATKQAAGLRLARCLCADQDEFDAADAGCAAQAVADAQATCLAAAIDMVCQRHQGLPHVILSGHGDFLTRRALEHLGMERSCVSLRDELGPHVSRCASAHALAVLASEARW